MAQGDLLGAVMQSDIGATGAAGVANWDATTPRIGKGIQLLDNWYLVGGGTANAFPINQRKNTSYSNVGEFIFDRWKLVSGSVTITSSGITLNGTIQQTREQPIGQTVVASALCSDGTMLTPTYNDSTKVFTLTASNKTIVAAKLELGDTQTLARQVNGNWVLNDPPPNYQQELAKCQRYYEVIKPNSYNNTYLGVGWTVSYGTTTYLTLKMAPKYNGVTPNVTMSGIAMYSPLVTTAGIPTEITVYTYDPVSGTFCFALTGASMTGSTAALVLFKSYSSSLVVSCEL